MAHHPPNTRRVLSLIEAKFRDKLAQLKPDEAFDVRSGLLGTQKLLELLKRSRLNRQKHPKKPVVRTTKRQTAKWKPTKGIYIDGIRCCRVCNRPIPHKTKDEWRYHMLAVKRRHMQQKAKEYWTRVGYHTMTERRIDVVRRRSIDRKLAIFKEECPLTAAKMTDADITRLILGYVNPKTGYMHGLIMFRRWVKRRFR